MKNIRFRLSFLVAALMMAVMSNAQSHGNRLSLGVGALYERGFDATLAVEHETKNHNAWEYFVNGYVKWDKDTSVGHVTKQSFWENYRTWGVGMAYTGRDPVPDSRVGASCGSDTHEVVGWANIGYEHNYVLRHGWQLYWQVKTDVCINGKDLFRTGIVLGFKIPTGSR